jgi:hypothetical protein
VWRPVSTTAITATRSQRRPPTTPGRAHSPLRSFIVANPNRTATEPMAGVPQINTVISTWNGEGDLNSDPDEVTLFCAYMKVRPHATPLSTVALSRCRTSSGAHDEELLRRLLFRQALLREPPLLQVHQVHRELRRFLPRRDDCRFHSLVRQAR